MHQVSTNWTNLQQFQHQYISQFALTSAAQLKVGITEAIGRDKLSSGPA
jgi:hypothetical protein